MAPARPILVLSIFFLQLEMECEGQYALVLVILLMHFYTSSVEFNQNPVSLSISLSSFGPLIKLYLTLIVGTITEWEVGTWLKNSS